MQRHRRLAARRGVHERLDLGEMALVLFAANTRPSSWSEQVEVSVVVEYGRSRSAEQLESLLRQLRGSIRRVRDVGRCPASEGDRYREVAMRLHRRRAGPVAHGIDAFDR